VIERDPVWTIEALRQHLEQRLADADRRVADARTAVERISDTMQRSIDELRRLVYIGMGIGLALQIMIPLLRKL
jgi:hypothetical protein